MGHLRFDYERLLGAIASGLYTEDQTKAIYRKLCLSDTYFMLRYALGRKDVEDNPWAIARCNDPSFPDKTVHLWFRGGYKSTIHSLARLIQRALKNPTHTHNIFSFKAPIAQKFLTSIRDHLIKSKILNFAFPDIIPQGRDIDTMLTNHKIRFYTCPDGKRENTFDYSGLVEGQPTSLHYDHLHYDDIVTPEAVKSSISKRNLVDAYKMSLNLMAKGATQTIIGTIYAHDDLFNDLKEMGDYHFVIHPVINQDRTTNYYSPEDIADKKKMMGSYIFSCQMMLDPIPPDTKLFFPDRDLLIFDLPKFFRKNYQKIYILNDPASSDADTSCENVVMAVGYREEPNKHPFIDVLEYQNRIGVSVGDNCESIIDMARRWQADAAYVEAIAYQKVIIKELKRRMQDSGLVTGHPEHFWVKELKKETSMNKFNNILRIQPFLESGRITVRPDMVDLFEQLDKYPKISLVDIIDLLGYAVMLAPKPKFDEQSFLYDSEIMHFLRFKNNKVRRGVNSRRRVSL